MTSVSWQINKTSVNKMKKQYKNDSSRLSSQLSLYWKSWHFFTFLLFRSTIQCLDFPRSLPSAITPEFLIFIKKEICNWKCILLQHNKHMPFLDRKSLLWEERYFPCSISILSSQSFSKRLNNQDYSLTKYMVNDIEKNDEVFWETNPAMQMQTAGCI